MAGYLEKLTADMKAAMKAREQDKLTVLRMIISDIKKKAEVEGEFRRGRTRHRRRRSRRGATRSTRRRPPDATRSRRVSSSRSR